MSTDDLIFELQEAVKPELFQVEMWLREEIPEVWKKLTPEDQLDLCRLLQEPFGLVESEADKFFEDYVSSAFEMKKSELIDTIREEIEKEAKELEDRAAKPVLVTHEEHELLMERPLVGIDQVLHMTVCPVARAASPVLVALNIAALGAFVVLMTIAMLFAFSGGVK
jgi:hypothetical protein